MFLQDRLLGGVSSFSGANLSWAPGSIGRAGTKDPAPPIAIDNQPFRVSIADTARYYGAASTTHNVNLPRYEVGQWIFILWQAETAATGWSASGWTSLGINTGGGGKNGGLKRKCDGTEGATVAVTIAGGASELSAVAFTLVNWSGVTTQYEWDGTGTSATPDPSNAVFQTLGSALNERRLVVEFAGWCDDTKTLNRVTPGYSKIGDVGGDGTATSTHIVVAFRDQITSGTVDPAAMSISGSTAWIAGSFGFYPIQFMSPNSTNAPLSLLGLPVLQQPANGGWYPMVAKDNAANDTGNTIALQTSYVMTLPTGSLAGLRVVGAIHMNGESAAPTLPGGWTQIANTNDAAPFGLCSFYRDCDGSEGATITITNASGVNHSAGYVFIPISKFDPSVAPEFTTSSGSSNQPDPASITPSWGSTRRSLFVSFTSNLTLAIIAFPTGSDMSTDAESATNARIAGVSGIFFAGSYDPAIFDLTGAGSVSWLTHTIAIKGKNNAVAYLLSVGQGSMAINGQAAALEFGRKMQASQGSYNINGQAATLLFKRNMPANQGTYNLNGQVVQLERSRIMAMGQGSYVLNGQIVNLLRGRRLIAIQGSYNLNGQTVALERSRIMAMGGGNYALNGQTINLLRGRTLSANFGSYNINGQAVVLLFKRLLSVGQGTYNLNGQLVAMRKGRTLDIGFGNYNIAGQAAVLLFKHVTPVGQGSMAINGQPVVMTKGRTMAANQGTYNLNGQIANLIRNRRLIANQGTYNLNGQPAQLERSRVMAMVQGSYQLTGQIVNLLRQRRLIAIQGSYLLTGMDVALTFHGNRPPLLAAPGFYALTGGVVDLRTQRRLSAGPGAYLMTGQEAMLVWKHSLGLSDMRAVADERSDPALASDRAGPAIADERSTALADERNDTEADERNNDNAD